MKPSVAISAVVLSVLATIAIEESRISKMRADIIRLRALPKNQPSAGEKKPEVAPPELAPAPPTPTEEVVPEPQPDPEPPMPLPGQRQVPEDFPDPSDEQIQTIAAGPYSYLHLELGLNNRQCAYFDELLVRRATAQQDLVMKWAQASAEDRPAAEQAMQSAIDKNANEIRAFLNRDADFETFAAYDAMQPEREMLGQLAPLMDQYGDEGVALELAKEKELVKAMYGARIGANALDWNSPAALKEIAGGGAMERFEKEWAAQSAALATSLAAFLTEDEAAAFLASREQLKESISGSIKSAAEALGAKAE